MKVNKAIAAAAALCMTVCTAAPAAYIPSAPCLAAVAADETEFTEGFLTYRTSGNSAVIVSCDKDAEGKIVIPDYVNDMPVRRIGAGAFRDCTGITSVTLNYWISEISDRAFEGCAKLKEVIFADNYSGFDNVGSYAFAGCASLETITLPERCQIGSYAFSGCTSLVTMELPKYLENVPEGLFEGCTALKSVSVSYCVNEIGKEAFKGCTSLDTVSLADSAYKELAIIGEAAFSGCSGLESIDLPDGVITIKDKAFEGCIKLDRVGIPDSLTDVSPSAFSDTPWKKEMKNENGSFIVNDILMEADNNTELHIPEDVKRIASGASEGCTSTETIYIENTLETVDADAFSGFTNLKDVYYNGFEAQWEALKQISEAEGNEILFEQAAMHFREDELEEDEYYKLREGRLYFNIYRDHAEVIDCYEYFEGDMVIPSEVNGIPVTAIDFDAFYGCDDMTSVTIPDSITVIEGGAFSSCAGLTSITIPDSVIKIGEYTFENSSSLEVIDLPEGLTDIPKSAFYGTPWLENKRKESPFVIVNGILIDAYQCSGDVVIPDGVKTIGIDAFWSTTVTSVTIPDSVTEIKNHAFRECHFLRSLDIPDSVTYIGPEAFAGSAITSLVIPGSVKKPDPRMFSEMNELDMVTFLEGTEVIPCSMFSGMTTLHTVRLPDSVTKIDSHAFDGCRSLTGFNIPESVTDIGDGAFIGCRSLTSLTVPEGVTNIRMFTFQKCYALNEIYLPAGLESINKGAFQYCERLEDVNFAGTEEQWEALKANSNTLNNDELFKKATIHFNTAPPVPVFYGDANGDGKITVSDAVAVLQYIANAEKYPIAEELLDYADCDGEAGITGNDAIMIQRYDAGLIESFPSE